MRVRQAIITVVLALGAAGSILSGSALPAVAAQAPAAHALATSSHAVPYIYHYG